MIVASVLALLASSSLELGGAVGIGRLVGEPSVAQGRDGAVVDPLRNLWTGTVWMGYQWRRGHLLAMRYDHSQGSGSLANQPDLGEALEETLTLEVFGMEYVSLHTKGTFEVRLGGGLGYAKAVDRLQTRATSLRARGEGMALWMRSGIGIPVTDKVRWHLEGVGQWSSFAAMNAEGLEPYETDFPALRLETGLSLGL